jgi:hypothetical protein
MVEKPWSNYPSGESKDEKDTLSCKTLIANNAGAIGD